MGKGPLQTYQMSENHCGLRNESFSQCQGRESLILCFLEFFAIKTKYVFGWKMQQINILCLLFLIEMRMQISGFLCC